MKRMQTWMVVGALSVVAAATGWAQDPKAFPPPAPAPAPAVTPQAAAPASGARWVGAQGGSLPSGATPTGYEPGGYLYTCRAAAESGTHPGKTRPGFGGCFVPLGGAETSVPAYEVLVMAGPSWVFARDGQIPEGAVEAGRTRTGQPLYACRAATPAGAAAALAPGKVGAGLRGCNVGSGGREVTMAFYEVLVQR